MFRLAGTDLLYFYIFFLNISNRQEEFIKYTLSLIDLIRVCIVNLCLYLWRCLSVCLSFCLSGSLSVALSVPLSLYLSVGSSVVRSSVLLRLKGFAYQNSRPFAIKV